ncbi:MAG: SpoIIIAH-like family protein [Clostridia bacterium]|nr:SpoIIIAH-like family protein [Clostridia bacterium]
MNQLKTIEINEEEEEWTSEETALVPQEETEERPAFPVVGKWMEKLREKVKPFPWKGINAKNAIIAGCLVIVAVAGYLNIRYGAAETPVAENPEEEAGEVLVVEDYFTSAIIDRERARGEALEVLVGITEDEGASEVAKTEAFSEMERIANETSWEIDIENLVKAKGFEECVAIISDGNANIVVESEGLTPGQIAQIKEIVYLESSIQPKDIKIIEK